MELYLQLGHGMQSLSQELIKNWGKGTAIISPVNMPQAKLAPFAKKIQAVGKCCLIHRCFIQRKVM